MAELGGPTALGAIFIGERGRRAGADGDASAGGARAGDIGLGQAVGRDGADRGSVGAEAVVLIGGLVLAEQGALSLVVIVLAGLIMAILLRKETFVSIQPER